MTVSILSQGKGWSEKLTGNGRGLPKCPEAFPMIDDSRVNIPPPFTEKITFSPNPIEISEETTFS